MAALHKPALGEARMPVPSSVQAAPSSARTRLPWRSLFAPNTDLSEWDEKLNRWAVVLIGAGLFWRLLRYLLCMPVWGDEAFIALNLMERDFSTILQPLDYMQVAPALFLLSELAVQKTLGASEYALRLLPLLAGLGSVFLFWRWCRLLLSGSAVTFALGFFVLGYYPVRHAVEIKPYAYDQLAATGLLFLATAWLLQPQRTRYGWFLAAALPLALAGSYPSVFLAGGVLLAATMTVGTRRERPATAIWLACGLLTAATFLLVYQKVGNAQYHSTGTPMQLYWKDSFPPSAVPALLRWLVNIHTGNLFAYPVGGKNGGSTLTFLLFLIGACGFIRRSPRPIQLLLFAPFALTFIAAILHRYPYGGSARIAQHLAPVICLLAAWGLQMVFERTIRTERRRQITTLVTLVVLLLVAVIGMIRDVQKPYKSVNDQQVRQIVRTLPGPTRAIVVAQPVHAVPVNQQYYLRRLEPALQWNGANDPAWTTGSSQELLLLNFDSRLDVKSGAVLNHWTLQEETVHRIQIAPEEVPYWQVTRWTRR